MAIPSGSGSEVVKTSLTNTSSSSAEQVLINGVANLLYTIVSVVICNSGGSPGNFDLYIDDDGGGTDYYLFKNHPYTQDGTFVVNDKFSIVGTDHLCFKTVQTESMSIIVTYIDQDWS